jgi:integrase
VDYLRHGRPQTDERRVFFRALAPVVPMSADGVSGRARHYLLKAGIDVPRPGSHTLRHTCPPPDISSAASLSASRPGSSPSTPTTTFSSISLVVPSEALLAAT